MHLRELLTYLNHQGVGTLTVAAQHGLVGGAMHPSVDVSYLADNVILMRYFEVRGRVRQAISIFKKRSGQHERTVRELGLGSDGITVGPPLEGLNGLLTGAPTYEGEGALLSR
jgi:circadian clock protein KaiC